MHFDTTKSIVQEIIIPQLSERKIQLLIKRDDLIHPEVSGNKWRKLKYIIEHFFQSKKNQILTFGGAFSNHLIATASACKLLNIPCIGIIRGEELNADSNYYLKRCTELGMKLHFVSRDEYALRNMNEYHEALISEFPNSYIIPEGGANYYGMIGCQEIIKEIPHCDHIFVAQGTSTTSCGLLLGIQNQQLHVVPSIKNYDSKSEMTLLYKKAGFDDDTILELFENLQIHSEYHFGGYAKTTNELMTFIDTCRKDYQLPLDKVYTSKAFYGLMQEIQKTEYNNSKILFVHTGGFDK